jgi:hypothetical protein
MWMRTFGEGDVIGADYRIVRAISQGGMGAVYLVEQLSTGNLARSKRCAPSSCRTRACIDGPAALEDGELNGISLAWVRAARCAEARGDHAHARELAKRVVDAWSMADAPVPAVQEMRALLEKAEGE